MRNKIKFYLGVIIVLIPSFLFVDNNILKPLNIKSALEISGISFSDEDITTMTPYIQKNKNSYINMRGYKLDKSDRPAFNFTVNDQRSAITNYEFKDIKTELPEDKKDIAFLSIGELSYLIKNKKISSVDVTKIYIERIKSLDKQLKSFVTLTEELALEQAERADEEIRKGNYRGILHGIPYGVKDLASFPGYPTTWGAMPLRNQFFNEKAYVIQRLESAGAVLLGKLSSGSLARGDVWFGGKTKNPWDLSQGSSGSSAGSAAAVSAALTPFAIGTETLGSIISPSTRCGVTGLRPTYGSIPTDGFMTLSWTMDKIGPIAKSPRDCAIVYNTIKKTNKGDVVTINFDKKIKNLRVGYLKGLFDNDTSRFKDNNKKTLKLIREEFEIEKINLPNNFPFSVFDIILRSEAGAFFDSFLLENLDSSMVEQGERSRANSLRQSRLIPAVEYIQASRHRKLLIKETEKTFNEYDIILSPSFGKNQLLITNLTGHPAISLPDGLDTEGRPTSISIIGNYGDEDKMLYFAEYLNKKINFFKNKPPLFY